VKELAEAGIDDDDNALVGLADSILQQHRVSARLRDVLCHVFFDLQAQGAPPAPTLKAFLALYNRESADTVEVTTMTRGASTAYGAPDFDTYTTEIMPKKAYEYLSLIGPLCNDVEDGTDFVNAQTEVKPATVSIPAEKWFTSREAGGMWRSVLEDAEDEGRSYDYFVKHYNDADRDARVLAIWVGDGGEEDEEDEDE
jgi:hypothetical protein